MVGPDRLFVYGTLRPGCAPVEMRRWVGALRELGAASMRGTLYRFAEYPALVLRGDDVIAGVLLQLPEDAETLEQLDLYEEFYPAALDKSLFQRVEARATDAAGEEHRCWVYVLHQPIAADADMLRVTGVDGKRPTPGCF